MRSNSLTLKYHNGLASYYLLLKTLIDVLETCGLLVDCCDVFSAVWTLILTAPIHFREQVM